MARKREAVERMMSVQRALAPQTAPHPAMRWWYTLAHETTPPAHLGASAAALSEFAEALAARGQTSSAALVAQITREVARAEATQRALSSLRRVAQARGDTDEIHYVWAFRLLGDALTALRANHRSDYHAYPQPQTLREASLDRLYQRFPLEEYPRTNALLFTGVGICDDPRLWANPRADALASALPEVIAPDDWDNYTVCGFRQGVSLVRVTSSARWLRVGPRTLEDAWAEARRNLPTPTARALDESQQRIAESGARDALLRAAPTEAFLRFGEEAASEAAQPIPSTRRVAGAHRAPAAVASHLRRPAV